MDINTIWADPMWRECFRLAMAETPRGVPGYYGEHVFDPFAIEEVLAVAEGEPFVRPWLGAFRMGERFVLISGRCDTTLDNGGDGRWEEASTDVQIAGTPGELVRLAMGTEERVRLGYPVV